MKGKRKRKNDSYDDEGDAVDVSPKNRSPKKKAKKGGDETCDAVMKEKRPRRFRAYAPQSYLEIKERALSQRLTVMGRERCGTTEVPEEKVLVAGSTGNLYTVHIGKVPDCDCPYAKKGNQCKHIIYVFLRVLKAPEHVGYQLALLSSELQDLFKTSPPIPSADAEADSSDGNRKPIEGECPICYMEFEKGEAIAYCKAACGNNVHQDCMNSWITVSRGKATCPYCRSNWVREAFSGNSKELLTGTVNEEGYVNVASQLGLSGERDYSTYHQPWVRSQRGYGYRH
ncbi:hypothetical protein P154DRAFT_544375 [Amniculicola lignicola CBS 123094]|uniref:SWIM-type domain-containing protein n=1 Tax=Amniculicola lignicola CBS 123094 TaxID=1392246 RepID=A0A6A5WLX2_9PLEO|nr:hypothetical protein P154DRAFT_544375 [Amniculicola lignicola CBS 123094]